MLLNKDLNATVNILIMPREEFLQVYNYYTSLEYDIFIDTFYQDLVNNVVNMYKEIKKERNSLQKFYTICLNQFVNTLSQKRQKEILKMINL